MDINRARTELKKVEMVFKDSINHIYNKFNLLMEYKLEELNFKENIMSIIYCILPICRITNLLKDKNFYVQDAMDKSKMMLVPPMKQIDFNFFNRGINTKLNFGISDLNTKESCQMSSNEFSLINYGIYTFSIGKNVFNLEIRESSSDGIIDMFIVETTLENAKIIVINKTKIIIINVSVPKI